MEKDSPFMVVTLQTQDKWLAMEKILFISPQPFFQWRGSPIRVKFNLLALSEFGYGVDLLTLPIGEDCDIEGVAILRVPNLIRTKQVPIGPSFKKIFFDLLLLIKGIQRIRKENYVVIHGVEEAGIIAVFLGWLSGCKVIFEKHSDPFSYRKGLVKNFLLSGYALVERITVKCADAVICTGEGLVAQVESMGMPTRSFHIFDIPSSLYDPKPESIKTIRRKLKNRPENVLITFVGSFAVYQGVALLMEAIPKVAAKCSDAIFIIIGGTDEEIENRKKMLHAEGIVERVRFLGMIAPDILPDYLSASDILLSPRISGVNTPLKLLDYFKAGRAIVATDVQSNRLLLRGDIALLAKPEPDPLARAICSLVQDRSKREQLGDRARRLYESRYNFATYKEKLKSCYQYVLNTSS